VKKTEEERDFPGMPSTKGFNKNGGTKPGVETPGYWLFGDNTEMNSFF
jgi:hypothetical protein